MARSIGSNAAQGLFTPFPDYVNHRTITTAETETVPTLSPAVRRVVITADADVWLSDGTAVIPSSDVIDGTGSFLLKAGVARGFDIEQGWTLSVISASGTAHVAFEYFS
jgi:hypothetical protein